MLTAPQCRAARALLGWTQDQLASASRVGLATLRVFEAGGSQPRNATLTVLRQALESAGVQFIEQNGGGPGVRLRKPDPESEGIDPESLNSRNDG